MSVLVWLLVTCKHAIYISWKIFKCCWSCLYVLQKAVKKQLDAFAEQLTIDESLTPVS